MARMNWAKQKSDRQARASLRADRDRDAHDRAIERAGWAFPSGRVILPNPNRTPPKQRLREQAFDHVEEAEAWGTTIKKLPTFLTVRCTCGHQKRVWYHGKIRPRYRCSMCGKLAL